MNAYNELYLDDAMCNMGEMLDYAVYDCGYELEEFFEMFANSRIGYLFGIGNPRYVTGMSGVELARYFIHEITNQWIETEPTQSLERRPEYWTGWVLAYFQNQRNISFSEMIRKGLTADWVISRYVLHEADLTKFMEIADAYVETHNQNAESALKRLRAYYGYTQKQLSEKSGVTLRMIQLYEQGQNDISKAQAGVVCSLAKALNCDVEDLLE